MKNMKIYLCLLMIPDCTGLDGLDSIHPDVLITMNNLGSVFELRGKHEEAESMLRQALSGYEKTLGAQHSDTLRNVSGLGVMLDKMGRHGEAESVLRRAQSGYEKALGAKHPDTIGTANSPA